MKVRQALATAAVALIVLPAAGAYADNGTDARGADTYVVQPGDTLTSIASRTGITVEMLTKLNQMTDADTIFVGSVLRLRDSAAGTQSTGSASAAARSSQALPATMAPSVVAASVSPQGQVQAQMAAAGPAPNYAVPIALAVGNPNNLAGAAPRGPISSTVQGTTASAVLNAVAPPRAPDPPSLLPTASTSQSVQLAMQYMGAPYEYGGANPNGFDCSGFVYYVLSRAGRTIPRDISGQYDAGSHPQSQVLQPGDLVFFKDTYDYGLSHVGIYLGNRQFIHALDESRGVVISSLDEPYYAAHWYGATRLS